MEISCYSYSASSHGLLVLGKWWATFPHNVSSLLLDRTFEMPDHRRQRDCLLAELFVSFGPPYEENTRPCADGWVMCWFLTCLGKRNRQFLFPEQIHMDWHTMGIRKMHVVETLRKGRDRWLHRNGEFSKPNVYIHSTFSFGIVFCLLFYDPLLSMRLVGIRCDCAPVDRNAWVFAHSHKQHNTLISAIWYLFLRTLPQDLHRAEGNSCPDF